MNNKGGNMTTVKYQNRSLILYMLKNSGAVSRVDIAQMLQLTPAAITILVNEMVKEGIIVEVGQQEQDDKRSGRKKILIDINYDFKHVIGINIESDWINIGVSNLKGDTVIHKRFQTDKILLPAKLLENIASECMNMLWKENIMKENILGVGVGIVGKVDREQGISNHAYALWNQEVNVKAILENAMGIRVVVDNNVRALAIGELDYHEAEETTNILFVKYGPGIGSAMTINNEIYYGSSNSAGELGHTIVEFDGEICKCGRRGCLETIASEKSLIKKAISEFDERNTPVLHKICKGEPDNITIENIYKAAADGDARVLESIGKVSYYMAIAIANAVSLYDPNKVILYGNAFKYDFVMEEFKRVIEAAIIREDLNEFITLSALNYKSNYIGGIALALREFFYNTGRA